MEAGVSTAALAVEGLSKSFGGQHALREVDFDVRVGEIHALLGANGAGKSTLIKVLAGVHHADTGTIRVGAATLPGHHGRTDAVRHGLAFVHQDLGLLDDLSVAENVALEVGYETRGAADRFPRHRASRSRRSWPSSAARSTRAAWSASWPRTRR